MESRHFPATLDYLHKMLEWVCTEAKKAGFEPSALQKIELATEEAIVNVIHHSYGDRGGDIEISIVSLPEKKLQISILDEGIPFDPKNFDKIPDTTSSLEERKIGGLGLFFIKRCLDEVRYQRKNDRNVLTLVKKM